MTHMHGKYFYLLYFVHVYRRCLFSNAVIENIFAWATAILTVRRLSSCAPRSCVESTPAGGGVCVAWLPPDPAGEAVAATDTRVTWTCAMAVGPAVTAWCGGKRAIAAA